MAILTGVLDFNELNMEMLDNLINSGIDLTWEEEIQDKTPEEIEELQDTYEPDDTVWLYGFKKDNNGKYEPDTEQPFSVVIRSENGGTVQVVHSKWVMTDLKLCSPCFPNQTDLDSQEGSLTGYALPSEYLNKENTRIKKISDT